MTALFSLRSPLPTAAYVHIPFCRRRCFYCDFPIAVVGDRARGETSASMQTYVDAVQQEISAAAAGRRSPPPPRPPLTSVFFGGGTPSLLSVAQLQAILTTLSTEFGLAAGAEISMEMDPGTFTAAHLQGYLAAGVNRVSLGAQAFQPEALQACGRSHQVADIYAAVELLHQAEVTNFSLDLISGLPHQTLADWDAGLTQAIALKPAHISVYDLTVEPQTAFGKFYTAGVAPLPTDDDTVEMYRRTQATLTQAGYDHYEISNYAKPGYACRHNLVYWRNQPYYGFGLGATSYIYGQRFGRSRTRQGYYDWLDTYLPTGQIDAPVTPDMEVFLDTLMLGLRLAQGINLADLAPFPASWRQRLARVLTPYTQAGWVAIGPPHPSPALPTNPAPKTVAAPQVAPRPPGDRPETSVLPAPQLTLPADALSPAAGWLRLTDPTGFLFSNVVLSAIFQEFAESIP